MVPTVAFGRDSVRVLITPVRLIAIAAGFDAWNTRAPNLWRRSLHPLRRGRISEHMRSATFGAARLGSPLHAVDERDGNGSSQDKTKISRA